MHETSAPRYVLEEVERGIDDATLRFADVVLNEATHEVWRAGTLVELTPREFDLLRFFLLNPRRVLSKQHILDRVWDQDFSGGPNIVETYVSYLRRKLHVLGPPLIHTVRFVGYTLRRDAV
jgi:two-component system, OmpR family, response regulator